MLLGKQDAEEEKRREDTMLDSLCSILNDHKIHQQTQKLAHVYEYKQNDENLKEILRITDPSTSHELHGWHLERLAVSEIGSTTAVESTNITTLQQDLEKTKKLMTAILEKGQQNQTKWQTMINEMQLRNDKLRAEVDQAKAAVDNVETAALTSPTIPLVSSPSVLPHLHS